MKSRALIITAINIAVGKVIPFVILFWRFSVYLKLTIGDFSTIFLTRKEHFTNFAEHKNTSFPRKNGQTFIYLRSLWMY